MSKDIVGQAGIYYVVDRDTGTILGTNVVAVPCEVFPDIDLSDSEVIDLAKEFGKTLTVSE